MKYNLVLAAALAGLMAAAMPAHAAEHGHAKGAHAPTAASAAIPQQRKVVTHGSVSIEGQTIHYTATAGTILLHGKNGKPDGTMFYVAYTKDGAKAAHRPVTFLYNGGPGSSSIWLHMGGIGPYRVKVTNAGATPPAPYSIEPNHESLLNDTDLVFIDAMGTGFSRVVGDGKYKQFWGVDQDVRAFGQFIQRYLSQNNRWNSPKFLYGESYGTTRSAALSEYLQQQGIALNGVILQSSILNYFIGSPGYDSNYTANLPSYAAIAWYHNKVPHTAASLEAFVQQAREFTDGAYSAALVQGDKLSKAQLDAVAQKMHAFTGLPVDYIERANLRVSPSAFRKQLLLPESKHMGRYDARYVGADRNANSSFPGFDPSDAYISPAFTAAFHWYLRNVLKYTSDHTYKVMNGQAIQQWDWKHGYGSPEPDVATDLASALRQNPYLRVLSENGYFDLATPFHGTEFDLDHMLLPPNLRDHVKLTYFKSGHMIYLNPKALDAMHATLDAFYRHTLDVVDKAATPN
ncbi:MAG TPA: peptidase S10 [Rhodanobacteraceae bacterium]